METLILALLFLFSSTEEKVNNNSVYSVMRKLLKHEKETPKRKIDLLRYSKAFKKYGKMYDVNLNLILAVSYVETGFKNIQNRKKPYDSGPLQVLPYSSHIKKFIDKKYGKPSISYKRWIRKNPIKAIHAGIWELSFYKKEYERYLKYKCKFNWRWKLRLRPKGINGQIYDFRFVPFYNWGNECYVESNKKPKYYPIRVMQVFRKIIKIRKSS